VLGSVKAFPQALHAVNTYTVPGFRLGPDLPTPNAGFRRTVRAVGPNGLTPKASTSSFAELYDRAILSSCLVGLFSRAIS